jgi:hypothetical protein
VDALEDADRSACPVNADAIGVVDQRLPLPVLMTQGMPSLREKDDRKPSGSWASGDYVPCAPDGRAAHLSSR